MCAWAVDHGVENFQLITDHVRNTRLGMFSGVSVRLFTGRGGVVTSCPGPVREGPDQVGGMRA